MGIALLLLITWSNKQFNKLIEQFKCRGLWFALPPVDCPHKEVKVGHEQVHHKVDFSCEHQWWWWW